MIKHINSFSTLTLLSCLFATVISQCPTFYADYNQQGESFQLCSSDNMPNGWDDRVSSFTVPAGYSVRLHKDIGFSGEFWGLYDLGSHNVPASFNDKLSSVSIFPIQDSAPKCPTFYTGLDLKGETFQLCSTSNLRPRWNDRVSSFVVPDGFSVQFYVDSEKRGESRGPYARGIYNVPASMDDKASSIVINNHKNSVSSNKNQGVECPTFYADADQQGDKFQLCSSGNVPDLWNDRVSSFVVPAGFTIQLYPDYNNGGDYWGPYAEGARNVPESFNNKMSSVVISRDKAPTSEDDKVKNDGRSLSPLSNQKKINVSMGTVAITI